MSWALQSGEDFSGSKTRVFQATEAEAGSATCPSALRVFNTGMGHLEMSQRCIGIPLRQGNVVEEVVRADLSQVWRLGHQAWMKVKGS